MNFQNPFTQAFGAQAFDASAFTNHPFAKAFQQNNFADAMKPLTEAMKPLTEAAKPYTEALQKMGANMQEMKTPAFGYNEALAHGRRNVEAASAAVQAAAESVQTIARRQAELARAQVEKTLKTSKEMFVSGSPESNTQRQIAFARETFETSLSNLREMSELVTKSGFEVFDVLGRRASETLDEFTKPANASKKKAA